MKVTRFRGGVAYTLAYQELDIAASTTDNPFSLAGAQGTEWTLPADGSLIAISVKSNAAVVSGTCTIKARLNGTVLATPAVVLVTNDVFSANRIARDVRRVVAGDRLELVYTTDATWLPLTADIAGLALLVG